MHFDYKHFDDSSIRITYGIEPTLATGVGQMCVRAGDDDNTDI